MKNSESLQEDLEDVAPDVQARVHRVGGMSDAELLSLEWRNQLSEERFDVIHPDDVVDWESVTTQDEERGERAIKDGDVAFVVIVDNNGWVGNHRAFSRIPGLDLSLLGWKLLQAGNMPVWVMSSPEASRSIQDHILKLALPVGLQGTVFEQFEGYCLTEESRLHLEKGEPLLYPLGSGDVGPALVESGVLNDNPNVKMIVACHVNNVMASPHAGLIGRHIRTACKVSCEVTQDEPAGLLFSTGTMIIDVDVLRWPIPWRWNRVSNRGLIQYERSLHQYTEICETDFVQVPRLVRHMPVMSLGDLQRAGELLRGYQYT